MEIRQSEYEKKKLQYVTTQYGVKYPDLNRIVRAENKPKAELIAGQCPGAVVVSRSVSEWLEEE